jgi:hypothetical protein
MYFNYLSIGTFLILFKKSIILYAYFFGGFIFLNLNKINLKFNHIIFLL